ncbi:ycf20-like protein isoform X2 [Zingiber officinale]|uniref:ycf20-like protein isoform X2 n=1 Tax=Zingiber officinale TaxID=94328 RepID=UPI001C4C861D|nr:ycf20-like protein isoform X2 [Zingiber officinale]
MAMHTLALAFCPHTLLIHTRGGRYLHLTYPERTFIHCAGKIPPRICFVWPTFPCAKNSRRLNWTTGSMADGNQSDTPESSTSSATRLIRTIQSFQTKLSARIKQLRKGIWIKIFFFLVGFYSATAFATVIGQTGDWDILSAGLAVVVVEGIGALMYRASLTFLDKFKSLITVFNYWKAGLSLGLFLDAFKYEIESCIESCKPSNFEIDIFPAIW